MGADEPSAPIGTITPNNNEKNESEKDNKPIEKIVEVIETNVAQDEEVRQDVATTPTVPEDFILIPNGTLKRYLNGYDDKWNNIYAEANEYVRIADQAYIDYADSFNESKGIVALTNYKKALVLNRKHGLFFVSERERIEQKVNILEKELKISIY